MYKLGIPFAIQLLAVAPSTLVMRILQICSARSIGGGERHVANLSNAMAQRGHNIFAAVAPNSPLAGELGDLPSENIARFSLRNAIDISSTVKIVKFTRTNGIEIIHAHLAKDYPTVAAAARLAGVPYVITRHVLFPMSRLHRRLLSNAGAVIAISNAVAASLRQQRIFPEEKLFAIRYGIDTESFPAHEPVRRDRLRVGAIGNLDPVKGFDVLIRAAAIVNDTRPEIEFEIVGEDRSRDGRNEMGLRRLIADLGLEKTVILSGWTSDVSSKLRDFDVFVSSSRSESFGAAIAEAMLSAVPVVASSTEGAMEIISDPSLGVVVPLDSPERLAEAILSLVDNDAKMNQLGRAGRDHVLKTFSLERMVDETESLYRRVISQA